MNTINKLLLALTFIALAQVSLALDNQRLAEAQKDVRIMGKILETTLSDNSSLFGQQIKGQYLYQQGYVFQIYNRGGLQFNVAVPPVAPVVALNDNYDLEDIWADYADIYSEWGEQIAKKALDSVTLAIDEIDTPAADQTHQQQLRQIKQQMNKELREIKQQLKQVGREQMQTSLELERKLEQLLSQSTEDYDKRQAEVDKIKQQQLAIRQQQEALRQQHATKAKQYQTKLLGLVQDNQVAFEHKLLSDFCTYSSSLRDLKPNEYVSFIFKNAEIDSGQDKIYVFNYTQVQNCQQDGDILEQILSKVTQYNF